MRDIKFRAWDKQAKKMTSPFRFGELLLEKDYDIYELVTKDDITIFYPGDGDYCSDIELMQYTGLKDKNGKEIYEGDILLTDKGNYHIERALPFVSLVDKSGLSYDNGDYYQGYNIESQNWNKFEVIGNTYENPELLNEKNT